MRREKQEKNADGYAGEAKIHGSGTVGKTNLLVMLAAELVAQPDCAAVQPTDLLPRLAVQLAWDGRGKTSAAGSAAGCAADCAAGCATGGAAGLGFGRED